MFFKHCTRLQIIVCKEFAKIVLDIKSYLLITIFTRNKKYQAENHNNILHNGKLFSHPFNVLFLSGTFIKSNLEIICFIN